MYTGTIILINHGLGTSRVPLLIIQIIIQHRKRVRHLYICITSPRIITLGTRRTSRIFINLRPIHYLRFLLFLWERVLCHLPSIRNKSLIINGNHLGLTISFVATHIIIMTK
ncbi:hypothetical protein Hanom_Chr02g00132451 [Helianthus anomalus]